MSVRDYIILHTTSGKTMIRKDTIASIVAVKSENLAEGISGKQDIHLTSGTIFSTTGASEILRMAYPFLSEDYFYYLVDEGIKATYNNGDNNE